MVGGSSIFKVVLMIGYVVAVDPMILEEVRGGVIKWFEWAPTAVQKVVTTSVEFSTGWHARHASNPGLVKRDCVIGQSPEVWGLDPLVAVVWQEVSIQRIEHHHNRLHSDALLAGGFQAGGVTRRVVAYWRRLTIVEMPWAPLVVGVGYHQSAMASLSGQLS